jgi:hypothetical protein
MARCDGIGIEVPESIAADVAAVIAELALNALAACSTRHDELRECALMRQKGAK